MASKGLLIVSVLLLASAFLATSEADDPEPANTSPGGGGGSSGYGQAGGSTGYNAVSAYYPPPTPAGWPNGGGYSYGSVGQDGSYSYSYGVQYINGDPAGWSGWNNVWWFDRRCPSGACCARGFSGDCFRCCHPWP
uniref:Glycine-rich protein n=1 Tax=Oryza glumipatula TaxID=40148 RepID=A0A0D9YU94_9ORYZ